MTAKSGKSFDATLQVNAEKKGIEFIFGENKSFKERQEQRQDRQQGKAPVSYTHLDVYKRQLVYCNTQLPLLCTLGHSPSRLVA